jgi:hypothetical protein
MSNFVANRTDADRIFIYNVALVFLGAVHHVEIQDKVYGTLIPPPDIMQNNNFYISGQLLRPWVKI